ncbi:MULTISPECIES: FaeA/PapI family transcriptional regulator [Serratia]|uniref:FaeA/PapI family transcriptional regulator n=1 Tax=Serratia TaxID=613 RepID=UPI001F4C4FAD|nr:MULTISPECIES: FaeA/PapI family transcriptional regulator [Serratia]ULG14332.1 hypothetical protein 28Fp_00045 [Serratia proteamaculans]ULG15588.1 hypothetical protein 465p1_00185 [Serratia proteamaculans]ULG17007.1 hypothetical protein 1772p1_00018 [Serratia proteamaculans]ULG17551.1 hypothetical protein Dp_00131 [Serratia proteamaculans]
MTEHPKIKPIELLLLEATTSFFDEKKNYSLSLPETWPTTREIADFCEMDIYRARYFLLKLVKAGLIEMKTSNINNSLRWCCIGHPSEPEIEQW